VRWPCRTNGRDEKRIRILKGRDHIGRHRRRCENNIKMGLREIRFVGVDWIHVAQDRGLWWALGCY
jgi:hypothetical protein